MRFDQRYGLVTLAVVKRRVAFITVELNRHGVESGARAAPPADEEYGIQYHTSVCATAEHPREAPFIVTVTSVLARLFVLNL